jgi:hypothetical protein
VTRAAVEHAVHAATLIDPQDPLPADWVPPNRDGKAWGADESEHVRHASGTTQGRTDALDWQVDLPGVGVVDIDEVRALHREPESEPAPQQEQKQEVDSDPELVPRTVSPEPEQPPTTEPPAPARLVLAAAAGEVGVVRRLLAAGAAPDALVRMPRGPEPFTTTALREAAADGHAAAAALLLDAGADPDLAGSFASPLQAAVLGSTPLIAAATHGRTDVLSLLLARGAAADLADAHGRTAFHYACDRGHRACVKALAAADCDKEALDEGGATGCMLADATGHDVLSAALGAPVRRSKPQMAMAGRGLAVAPTYELPEHLRAELDQARRALAQRRGESAPAVKVDPGGHDVPMDDYMMVIDRMGAAEAAARCQALGLALQGVSAEARRAALRSHYHSRKLASAPARYTAGVYTRV